MAPARRAAPHEPSLPEVAEHEGVGRHRGRGAEVVDAVPEAESLDVLEVGVARLKHRQEGIRDRLARAEPVAGHGLEIYAE